MSMAYIWRAKRGSLLQTGSAPGSAARAAAAAVNSSDSAGRQPTPLSPSTPPSPRGDSKRTEQIDQAARTKRPHRHDLADRVVAQGLRMLVESLAPRQRRVRFSSLKADRSVPSGGRGKWRC